MDFVPFENLEIVILKARIYNKRLLVLMNVTEKYSKFSLEI